MFTYTSKCLFARMFAALLHERSVPHMLVGPQPPPALLSQDGAWGRHRYNRLRKSGYPWRRRCGDPGSERRRRLAGPGAKRNPGDGTPRAWRARYLCMVSTSAFVAGRPYLPIVEPPSRLNVEGISWNNRWLARPKDALLGYR